MDVPLGLTGFHTGCSPVVVEKVVVLVVYCQKYLNVFAQDNKTEFVHLWQFEDFVPASSLL